jgi:flagellar hook-associated protein 2
MGTVGLSFGSPTSGAGFDVSSTVSSIVANLQNVETPWKTQLTSLESQDTAISNLGTLYSNLSNDLSSLTDFNGVMAEKTGSSSDTNVLTLTAANSTAVAGTYTVQVKSLAQTASGYLSAVSSASGGLTGSVTLQVGSGPSQTINVPTGDTTLAGLAAAINSSGVGISANVLPTSSGSVLSLVSGTSGSVTSAIHPYLGFTAAAGSTSSTGTLDPVANAGDVLSGSISIQVGAGTGENVVLGAAPDSPAANTIYTGSGADTLADVVSAINGAGLGYTASVNAAAVGSNAAGTILTLQSSTPGTAGTLTVNSAILDTSAPSLAYNSSVSGADAQMIVNGIGSNGTDTLTSPSNTVANLIPGVTFQLLAPSPTESDGSLEQVQVVIGNDNSGVESTFSQMVSDYNALISAVNTQDGNDSSGHPEPLFGSPTLSLLQQQLLGGLNTESPNGYIDSVTNSTDVLSGSLSIQVGDGTATSIVIGPEPGSPAANTIYTGAGANTLASIQAAINSGNLGVTANLVNSATGTQLELVSNTAGSSGALTAISALTDDTTGSALKYNQSGTDINSLTSLGISVNNDGSITFDATSLDSVLNSDYSGVVGFLQNANSWGQSFSSMLTNAGTSVSTGILALASTSNSNIESTLNEDISKESSLISAQQTSLTAELNSANEIMQELPSQLDGVNELYSAITGYNQNTNG